VVGDIVLLETGCKIPADCILIEGQDITVDETKYFEFDTKPKKKSAATAENILDKPVHDPFLLSDTLIASGSGKAVVCAVGAKCRRGIHEEPLDTSSKTPLQIKLQNLGGTFTKYALIAALIIFVAYLVNFILTVVTKSTGQEINYTEKIAEMFTLAIVIVMVAVPEGLPLAIVMSLAYSVM
jgi:Ca2+-transporting ATPase